MPSIYTPLAVIVGRAYYQLTKTKFGLVVSTKKAVLFKKIDLVLK
ncbi:hypothetical protein [Nonlabens spongiae]|nr:hypothetical protein [Nonlabens spongiae]